jgi:YD repeat-containing protein
MYSAYSTAGERAILILTPIPDLCDSPATQHNGRIVSSADGVTGENVSYTYDALNRLIAAASTGSVQWSGSYSYDGVGNLTSRADGGAPVLPQVNSVTNQARMIGDNGFDASGNWLGPNGSYVFTWTARPPSR